MIDGVMECSCGYRRNWLNVFDELFLMPHKIMKHKIIRSGKDIRNEIDTFNRHDALNTVKETEDAE